MRTSRRFALKKGYIGRVWFGADSQVKRRRGAKRTRRITPAEEAALLKHAGPWLHGFIIAAIESCLRRGELLALKWADVNLNSQVITVRAEISKTRTARHVPISPRLLGVLKFRQIGPDGKAHPPTAYVFGDGIGRKVASPKKAWTTCVLRAHDVTPEWDRQNGLSKACQAKLAAIDLHLHDARREGASRLLEAGWPLHHVQHLLGHTNTTTTSVYLSASLEDLKDSMSRYGTTLHTLAQPPSGEPLPGGQEPRRQPAQPLVN